MADYHKSDARAWAREHLIGCSAVTIPTFTADLKRLNEDAIRHDVERAIKHGFTYTLVMTETAITPRRPLASPRSPARLPPGACASSPIPRLARSRTTCSRCA